jgi:hypothetical protein
MNRVGLVMGDTAPVSSQDLTSKEWAEIITAAASSLTMESLRGLKGLRRIIEESSCAPTHLVSPIQWDELQIEQNSIQYFPFLELKQTMEQQRQLLLARTVTRNVYVYLLETDWRRDNEVWYLDAVRNYSCTKLAIVLETGDREVWELGLSALTRLREAQMGTARMLRDKEAVAYRGARRISGFLERLGVTPVNFVDLV